jgi:glutamate/tyrosine decarboxylase-like PLP-dependent enzyme
MGAMAGFGESRGGILTTGGSLGNQLGMLCARSRQDPTVLTEGSDGRKLVAFVSAETHYSCLMAANVLGIGYNNVVKVKCNEHG